MTSDCVMIHLSWHICGTRLRGCRHSQYCRSICAERKTSNVEAKQAGKTGLGQGIDKHRLGSNTATVNAFANPFIANLKQFKRQVS